MSHQTTTVRGSALDDMQAMLNATPNEREKARIRALMDALQARQRTTGVSFDSSYTPALKHVLKRERQRQQGASA